MRFGIVGIVSFLILAILLPGLAGAAAPSDYDECILKSMKGVKSDLAAKSIIRSCRNKFRDTPRGKLESRALSFDEMLQITGRARFRGPSLGDNFSGKIYNGNSDITVSEITIQITTAIGGKEITKLYRDDVTIEPQTAGYFGFNILEGDKDADYSWTINSAKGY